MFYEFWRVMDEPAYQWSGKQEAFYAEAKARFKDVLPPEDLGRERRRLDEVIAEWPASWGM